MKKLGFIVILVTTLVSAMCVPISSGSDQVLCCYYCKPCKEQRCESQSEADCFGNDGTVVEDCAQCQTGKR